MDNQEIHKLINKFLTGKISQQERIQLGQLWKESANNEKYIQSLNEDQKTRIREEIFKGIQARIRPLGHKTRVPDITLTNYSKPFVKKKAAAISFNKPVMYRIAAVFIGMLMLAGIAYKFLADSNTVIYKTTYGQTSRIILPDNSVAILNGNSSLKYVSGWAKEVPREVWLEGEAYFTVVHTQNHQKFIVNTLDEVAIEVLGTEFNVSNRKTGLTVVLKSGKVKLNIDDSDNTEVLMEPGDLVEFKENTGDYIQKEVDPKVYSSWTGEKLIFNNHTLKEIIEILHDTYGLEVEVSDPSLLSETFTGSVPNNNVDMLLIGLSRPFDLKVLREDNNVKISNN